MKKCATFAVSSNAGRIPFDTGHSERNPLNFNPLLTQRVSDLLKASRLSQKLHKWLGLFVGIQLLIWTLSGFYMVVVNIDIIHGDHLVQPPDTLGTADLAAYSDRLRSVVRDNPDATAISIKPLNGSPVVQVRTPVTTRLMSLENGAGPEVIDEALVRTLAQGYYAGTGAIESLTLIENNPPREIGARPLPLWRVDFDDVWGSTLYISSTTGALATRRHTLWRGFDFVWMLHIMDYDEREDINNWILRVVSSLGFLLVVTGVWYLYFRLNMRRWFKSAS